MFKASLRSLVVVVSPSHAEVLTGRILRFFVGI